MRIHYLLIVCDGGREKTGATALIPIEDLSVSLESIDIVPYGTEG